MYRSKSVLKKVVYLHIVNHSFELNTVRFNCTSLDIRCKDSSLFVQMFLCNITIHSYSNDYVFSFKYPKSIYLLISYFHYGLEIYHLLYSTTLYFIYVGAIWVYQVCELPYFSLFVFNSTIYILQLNTSMFSWLKINDLYYHLGTRYLVWYAVVVILRFL